jgi:hypothetical protein
MKNIFNPPFHINNVSFILIMGMFCGCKNGGYTSPSIRILIFNVNWLLIPLLLTSHLSGWHVAPNIVFASSCANYVNSKAHITIVEDETWSTNQSFRNWCLLTIQNFKSGPKSPRVMFQNHSILWLQKKSQKTCFTKEG